LKIQPKNDDFKGEIKWKKRFLLKNIMGLLCFFNLKHDDDDEVCYN